MVTKVERSGFPNVSTFICGQVHSPIQLYAVNQAVEFVPHVNTLFILDKTSVTDQHWSVRKHKAAMPE
jgi:hypothetical protein